MVVVAAVAFLALPVIVWQRVRARNDDQLGALISIVCGIVGVVATFVALGIAAPKYAVSGTFFALLVTGAVSLVTTDSVLVAIERIKGDRLQIAAYVLALAVWPVATQMLVGFAFVSQVGQANG